MSISRRIQFELAGRIVAPAMAKMERLLPRTRSPGRTTSDSKLFGPPLESTRQLKDLLTRHYLAGRFADGAVPVAWVTSGFPVELLRPFGFHVVYPENHGALCSARHLVPELSAYAEARGYSRDLCGYARTDLGCVLSQKTPVGRLPKPDLLCCCTNICQTVLYWYRILAEHFRVPLVVIDTPYVYGEARPHETRYVLNQLENLLDVAVEISGQTFDPARLTTAMRLSREGCSLWADCLHTGVNRPSPWTGFDSFIHMAPIVALRGTEECNSYYRSLRDELEDRVVRGIGGIREERHRLLWDNLPIWYDIRNLATLFARHGFNFVCTTYTNAWAEPASLIDESAPLASAAQVYSHVLLNRDLNNRLRVMRALGREFAIDGAVFHSDRSCKPYSVGQLDLKETLARDLGIRVVLIEADHADPRAFAKEPVENRLSAFIESFA